jgi:hypothetical protein
MALLLALLVAAGDARADVSAQATQEPAAGELFVLTAAGGELERVRGQNGVFRLVLRQPARDATGFTDRPARRTGQHALGRFVDRWAKLGFAEVPPNAAVVLADAPGSRDVLIVELSRPRLGPGGRTLTFRAELLRGKPGGRLRGLAKSADRRISSRFGRVSLFVDPGGQEVHLTFTLSSIPRDGYVSIAFSNAQIDLSGILFADADAPTTFSAASTTFLLRAKAGSPVNGSVQMAINVTAGADCALGKALITAGTSATVTVAQTRRSFPVTNGPLCIPIV